MSLAAADAITTAVTRGIIADGQVLDVAVAQSVFAAHYLRWAIEPENNRAPGRTCMTALNRLRQDPKDWPAATLWASKGCGANMRTMWLGVDDRLSDDAVQILAARQSVVTHGHPTAVVSTIASAAVMRALASRQITLADALAWTRDFCVTSFGWDEQRRTDVLSAGGRELEHIATDRPARNRHAAITLSAAFEGWTPEPGIPAHVESPAYGLIGVKETSWALAQASRGAATFRADPWASDPCAVAGAGWTAQEALAVALLVVDAMPDSPVEGLRRAASSGGDSDSIAAITGALYGAAHGGCWPAEWKQRLEPRYQRELAEAVQAMSETTSGHPRLAASQQVI